MKKWSESETLKFVELYRKYDCLWDRHSMNYKNKTLRRAAEEDLLHHFGRANFGVPDLKQKIKNLRCTYHQELMKIQRSKEAGGDVYVPNMKWFRIMDWMLGKAENEASGNVALIELYKSQPALWQLKNKDYRDRAKKTASYQLLINKCREVEPNCDKSTVVKKINSIRTTYRKELKKVQKSLEGSGEVYKPKLWYFHLLSFLSENEDDQLNLIEEDCDPLTPQIECLSESATSSPASMFVPCKENEDFSTRQSVSSPTSMFEVVQQKKRPREEAKLRVEEDEFDLLGRLYANKLRKLEKDQRIFAEKIINDTLFEAELGNLNRSCRLLVRSHLESGPTHTEIHLKSELVDDMVDTSFIE